ncbi:MAG: LamG domain-containing protein [Anaerolineae bacterium]
MSKRSFVQFGTFCLLLLLTLAACTQPAVPEAPAEPLAPTSTQTNVPTTTTTPIPEPTTPPTATPEPDLNTKLSAHYTFSGNANDSTENGNDGVVNGATLIEDRFGNAESAYDFDGIDDYIEIEHSKTIGLFARSSVSAWVYIEPQAQPTWYTIIEKSDPERGGHSRWGLWLIRDRVEFCIQPGSTTTHHCLDSAEPVEPDSWHHVVGVWTGDTIQLYIDGALSLEQTHGRDGISNTGRPLFFGTDLFNDTVIYTKMQLDDVRIYQRALSAEEVTELFELESTP